jgi:hypothetical protein
MREADLEQLFRVWAAARGARTFKWVSPGQAGVPDRVVVWPGGRVSFVELKAPGKKPSPLQAAVFADLHALGAPVSVLSTKAEVEEFWRAGGAGSA